MSKPCERLRLVQLDVHREEVDSLDLFRVEDVVERHCRDVPHFRGVPNDFTKASSDEAT